MTTGKSIALTRWTFVGKVMSLLFNMLSWLEITFLQGASVFYNMSVVCIRWPNYWSFSLNISPSNEYSGLIFFRIAWFDLLTVQETIKSLLQHHSLKTSILQCSAFLMAQLSHPYMTTGRTIALTIWTFAGKVMSLLLNILSRLVITFRPRNIVY